MAGHNKWSKIKRQKAVTDAKRSGVFTKIAKEIAVAAKTGGGADPDYNFKLKTIIAKAKTAGVPKSNIDRALEKAAGKGEGDDLKEIIYEGYLPGGVAVMVMTATDNTNRTYADIRTIFNKSSGSIGNSGCVAYMFQKQGQIKIEKPEDWNEEKEEELFNIVLDVGGEDLDSSDEEEILLSTPSENFQNISEAFEKALEASSLELKILETKDALVPENSVEVGDEDDAKNIIKAMEAFDDNEDVIDIVANFEFT